MYTIGPIYYGPRNRSIRVLLTLFESCKSARLESQSKKSQLSDCSYDRFYIRFPEVPTIRLGGFLYLLDGLWNAGYTIVGIFSEVPVNVFGTVSRYVLENCFVFVFVVIIYGRKIFGTASGCFPNYFLFQVRVQLGCIRSRLGVFCVVCSSIYEGYPLSLSVLFFLSFVSFRYI